MSATSEDWLLVRIAAVEEAASSAREALAGAYAALEPGRTARLAGASLLVIAEQLARAGADPRRDVIRAIRAYQQAVTALRADVVRGLIDEEAVPLTALAQRIGMSRQALTRLYHLGQRVHADPAE